MFKKKLGTSPFSDTGKLLNESEETGVDRKTFGVRGLGKPTKARKRSRERNLARLATLQSLKTSSCSVMKRKADTGEREKLNSFESEIQLKSERHGGVSESRAEAH